MATTLEIKYFNSFVLKKSSTAADGSVPIWNGSFGIPQAIGGYKRSSGVENGGSWIIEVYTTLEQVLTTLTFLA